MVARPRDDSSLSNSRVPICRDRRAVARRHHGQQLPHIVLHPIELLRGSRHRNCPCLKAGHKAVPGQTGATTGTLDAGSRTTIPGGRRVRLRGGRVRGVSIPVRGRHRKAIKQLKQGFRRFFFFESHTTPKWKFAKKHTTCEGPCVVKTNSYYNPLE